jgi:hypothetical protein
MGFGALIAAPGASVWCARDRFLLSARPRFNIFTMMPRKKR